MPYFVFEIGENRKNPVLLEVFDKFRDAKSLCYQQRAQNMDNQGVQYKLIFAKNEREAKRLVVDKHQPSSPLEEWEA